MRAPFLILAAVVWIPFFLHIPDSLGPLLLYVRSYMYDKKFIMNFNLKSNKNHFIVRWLG
jgi:hypothetical protein